MQADLLKRLKSYGVDQEAGTIFLLLLQKGPQTALQLARDSEISRTQVYRILETLEKQQLVSVDKMPHKSLFQAMPYQNLEGLIESKEARLRTLRNSLTDTFGMLQAVSGKKEFESKVLHYSGLEGLKQVNWNLTRAEKEYRVYEVAHLSQFLDKKFAERCREKTLKKRTKTYDLTNILKHKRTDLEPMDTSLAELRYIDPAILDIKFEMYIYNDVVTMLDYSKNDIFCIEIYHETLSKMQKQIFDVLWSQAQPIILT